MNLHAELMQLIFNFSDLSTKFLLRIAYPKLFAIGYVDVPDLCKYAAEFGHLDLLIWANQNKFIMNKNLMEVATDNGRTNIVKWLLTNTKFEFPSGRNYTRQYVRYFNLADFAAAHNDLELLKMTNSGFSRDCLNHAASNGNIKMLKWLFKKNCTGSEYTSACAARNGHLEAMIYLEEICGFDYKVRKFAKEHNQLEILNWLDNNGY
jgi:hypothetical protein